jgi:lactate dehydrogenase-like 2-hydroxyacid dehydrogenase
VEYLLVGIDRGDFYIICPDNDVSSALDKKRILWAAGDVVENRPPLSRWHSDYAAAFKKFAES